MVRAAAWILLLRGLGLLVGGLVGTLARRQYGDASVCLPQWVAIPSLLWVLVGLGVLSRTRSFVWVLPLLTLGWFLVLASPFAPEWLGNDGSWDPFDIAKSPWLAAFLPAFFLPDVFALYSVFRRDGRAALAHDPAPLASLSAAWRVRLTGRVLVSLGMVVLVFLSTAVYLLCAPGVMAAWSHRAL
mgnify:CR=1 FL=1